MRLWITKYWSVITILCIYWAIVVVLVAQSVSMNESRLVYPLDDTYIHMSVARNAVLNHVWGVTRYEFTSSTSSLLWPLVLAGTYLVTGVNDFAPLVLNAVFGTLAVIASSWALGTNLSRDRQPFAFGVLLLAVLASPLPTLTVIGMEHVLHTLLTVCLVFVASSILAAGDQAPRRQLVALIALAPLVTMSRYEGLFAVLVVCCLLLVRRRFAYGVAVGAVALMPIAVFGIWSMVQGWYFLPNSVIIKAQLPALTPASLAKILSGYDVLVKVRENTHILVLLAASLLGLLGLYSKRKGSADGGDVVYANLIFVGALLLHMQFAHTGYLFRYEAYLVLIGVVTIGRTAVELLPNAAKLRVDRESIPGYAVALLLLAVAVVPLVPRMLSVRKVPQATHNIFEQQYQMGLFLRRFYQGKAVALNDIGLATYLSDIRLLDLAALGSMSPAQLVLLGRLTPQDVYNLGQHQGVEVAIVYDRYYTVPPQWSRIGQWTIPNNFIAADATVTFYATDAELSHTLQKQLREFSSELPVDVKQTGEYVGMR